MHFTPIERDVVTSRAHGMIGFARAMLGTSDGDDAPGARTDRSTGPCCNGPRKHRNLWYQSSNLSAIPALLAAMWSFCWAWHRQAARGPRGGYLHLARRAARASRARFMADDGMTGDQGYAWRATVIAQKAMFGRSASCDGSVVPRWDCTLCGREVKSSY